MSLTGAGNVTAGSFVPKSDIDAHKLVFTPVAGTTGTPYTNFTFRVKDDGGTNAGSVDLDTSAKTATFNIVTGPNHAPTTNNANVNAFQGQTFTFHASDFPFTDSRAGYSGQQPAGGEDRAATHRGGPDGRRRQRHRRPVRLGR